ncbi:MAG TPA: hypothetical protein VK776_10695 [Bryobacteraceae bacterium]|nr:hypothetical protein [Bryobacteraceae bacterium]
MRNLTTSSAFLALVLFAYPGKAQDHPNLAGTWQFDSSRSDQTNSKVANATWVIEEGDNSIHIVETESGNAKKVELKCSTDGKDCNIAGGGKATASFWFNGPMLVEMETRGEHVNRYRMKLSDDAKALTVEVSSIVPRVDKADVLVFQKQ